MQRINDEGLFGVPEQEFSCSLGPQGDILFTTPEMTTFLAYEREELNAKHFVELVHPEDHPDALKQLSALQKQADRIAFTARYKTASGKYRMLDWAIERCGRSMYTATAKLAA